MNIKFLSLASITFSLVAFSAPAFAGGVTNTTTTRHGRVNSNLQVDSHRVERGYQINRNQNLKVESFGPGFAKAEVRFDGYKMTGNAYADNVVNNPDPYAISVYSNNFEKINFLDTTNTSFTETFRGTETTRTHDVESF